MVTFSPDVPYSEALRIGDEQNKVMEKIMALPNIKDDWDEQYVMDQLFGWHLQYSGTDNDFTTEKLPGARGRYRYRPQGSDELWQVPALIGSSECAAFALGPHDEMLFIVIDQASELWLKLAGHEVEAAIRNVRDDDFRHAFKVIARVKLILMQLTQSWSILSTDDACSTT